MTERRCSDCGRWVNDREENVHCRIEGVKRKEYCEECWPKKEK